MAFVDNDLDALQIAGATPEFGEKTAVCMDLVGLVGKISPSLKGKK